jgi:hypothetical protein
MVNGACHSLFQRRIQTVIHNIKQEIFYKKFGINFNLLVTKSVSIIVQQDATMYSSLYRVTIKSFPDYN